MMSIAPKQHASSRTSRHVSIRDAFEPSHEMTHRITHATSRSCRLPRIPSKLSTSSYRAKYYYMLYMTLRRVMMLSPKPPASSSSTWYVVPTNILALTLFVYVKVVNRSYDLHSQLDLLSKVNTPKLREWGTNCLGKNPY